ncbi:hypothetical protein V6N13_072409 [Hibiscus sabdariffa]|uniref:Uncharacterized protein n=1 Tax=Hibiscus sabdariffa TaxID=183260 RepID=A0ABR2R7S7_9ROSI
MGREAMRKILLLAMRICDTYQESEDKGTRVDWSLYFTFCFPGLASPIDLVNFQVLGISVSDGMKNNIGCLKEIRKEVPAVDADSKQMSKHTLADFGRKSNVASV